MSSHRIPYAIQTKFVQATSTRGSRMRASGGTLDAKSVSVAYDYELSARENHVRAARALAAELGFAGELLTITLSDAVLAHVDAARGAT